MKIWAKLKKKEQLNVSVFYLSLFLISFLPWSWSESFHNGHFRYQVQSDTSIQLSVE